jgi:hypothetical protein
MRKLRIGKRELKETEGTEVREAWRGWLGVYCF